MSGVEVFEAKKGCAQGDVLCELILIEWGDTAVIISESVTIRYPGLVPWEREDSVYYFKPQDSTTNSQRQGNINHFSISGLRTPLLQLFADYRDAFEDTAKFKITDMSLPLGGLLDVDSTAWANPHQTHREGRNADLGLDNMADNNRQKRFKNFCTALGLYCVIEGDHYHVNYSGS